MFTFYQAPLPLCLTKFKVCPGSFASGFLQRQVITTNVKDLKIELWPLNLNTFLHFLARKNTKLHNKTIPVRMLTKRFGAPAHQQA
uniref:Uncharacterized protein n=1 Tax=Aegilops tauschii subsp. strangulata TaxID=200361 RepID=A0A453FVL8_AEGTS